MQGHGRYSSLRTANSKLTGPTPFELLLDQHKIADRVAQIGAQITRDYRGKKLLLIGVLKGCIVFLSDIIRHITLPMEIELLSGAAYRQGPIDALELRSTSGHIIRIRGCDVLLVEGIVDTGQTAARLMNLIGKLEPASAEIVTLLDKPGSHRTKVDVKYRGFSIGNEFVVGYGLDNTQLYRNLPYIGRMLDV